VKGRITDAGGVRSVTIRWADGKRGTVRLRADGSFTARHRYKKAGLYRITIAAVDKAGNRTTRHVTARVRARG
jgi:hypothetical protein